MDPNANLKEMYELVEAIIEGDNQSAEAVRLAELVEAMDGWLRHGGFLPQRWAR